MKITVKEMETLQRMIGLIEGAVYGMGKRVDLVYEAVENICSIIDKAEVVSERGEPE